MLQRVAIVLLMGCFLLGLAATAPADPHDQFDLARHVQLPPGFVIEKIAGPPLVRHPLHVTFDDQGRCYVTEMAGVNRNRQELEKELPNGIKRLADSDGDGIYDKATQFADKMTFPAGILWHHGAIYTTSFPYLWKLIDKDGDGIADERIPLVGQFGSVGNGADLHGPQLGPDGWLYFCNGRNGHEVTLGDGTRLKGKASGLYRCKVDGSGLERVFAGGMDNPVEVAFTPAGEPLVCTNLILNSPRHDGILYGIEGAVYPYYLQAVQELKWTGQYLPIMGELGWVAVSSLVRREDTGWGPEYLDKYFTAEFNTHGIRMHTITRAGAGFTMKTEPFLTCSHPDFHPTQLANRPDGSMILVDTGGWFRHGCPTSQIAKPEIAGGIYRIRKLPPSSDQPKSQHGVLASASLLSAAGQNTAKVDSLISILHQKKQLNELWSQGRSLAEKVDQAVVAQIRDKLNDPDLETKLVALHFVALYRDKEAAESVTRLLEQEHPAVRRSAAVAIGKLQCNDAIPALINALEHAEDPFLEHALIFGLIRLNQPGMTIQGLTRTSSRIQRGVLIALDQMTGQELTWEAVAPLLQSSDARLKSATMDVVARRPQWINDLTDYVDQELTRKNLDSNRVHGLKNLLLALAPQPRLQQFIADRLACEDTLGIVRSMLLETMAQADLLRWPVIWNGPLASMLTDKRYDNGLMMQAVLAATSSGNLALSKQLRTLAETADRPLALRFTAAYLGLQDGLPTQDGLFGQLVHAMRPDEEPALRLAAARAFSVAKCNHEQLLALNKLIKQSGPLELPLLICPWEKAADGEDFSGLLAALEGSPGVAAMPLDRLQKLTDRMPKNQQNRIQALLKKGRPDPSAQKARLEEMKPVLSGGDIKRGRELFYGQKAVCSACHRVGGEGGLVGPQLNQIGSIRTRADLLEAILFPSSSLARGYESMVIVTKSGKTMTGVLTRETADALVLTNSQRIEQKVMRDDIDQMTASMVSTMPAGIDQTLTMDELRDILAYLESLKK